MTAWLGVRAELGDAALEIDHRQLVLEPEGVASSIAAFLELPEDAAARLGRYIAQPGRSRPTRISAQPIRWSTWASTNTQPGT
jgi:hypothetical protein